ncbi:MAG: SCO1664 family protein [Chloroflexi bacterium]|nr:SCO1664 family protein [Chloroflexota bacterium]
MPASHLEPHTTVEIIDTLSHGQIDLQGLLPWSTNYTFLGVVTRGEVQLLAVYKPCAGERPLWDFPTGTLCQREVAAYCVSAALGWDLVPPTVLREGPHGPGSVQLFIDCDAEQHYFTLKESHRETFKMMAIFDALLNNTDRKGGHCLIDRNGKVWAIDHGVTFHPEPKLRTVIWDYAGESIPPKLLEDMASMQAQLEQHGTVADRLAELLSADEIQAFEGRLAELLEAGRFPEPNSDWYTVPWPPV